MKKLSSAGLGLLLCFVLLTSSISQAQTPGLPSTPSIYPDWAVVDPQPEFEFAPLRSDAQSPPPPGTGYVPPPMDLSHLTGQRMPGTGVHQTLPASYDWRDNNGVTSVKNQGACGSCFAFAAVGNLEARMKVVGEGDFDFSENNAKECTYRTTSCGGGNFFDVVNLFTQKGTVLEACDPYVASDVSCNTSCPYQKTVLDWRIISDGVADTAVLKQYIHDYGPVYTAMYAGSSAMAMADPNGVHAPTDAWGDELQNYNGTYTLYYGGSEPPNHAVLIVGWDDTLTHAGGSGGWIVKNSWGAGWGDSGFFYIAYGSAQMGTASAFVYEWQDYDNDGSLWYYDEGGLGNAMGCGNTTAWGLVRFTPPNNTNVTRVDFWTIDTTTDVDIYIYDDFDGSTTSNLLASKLNNAFNEAGYHSVPLDTPLAVTSGDDVVVVVKFTNQSLTYPVVIDSLGPPENGRTYMSCSGSSGSWTDMGTDYNVDVAIRLRTGSLTPAPSITSITPSTGVNTGTISITNLAGANFQNGATVKLTRSGQPDINGTSVSVVNDSQITCNFDLTGAAVGQWNVVVTNPDAQSGTLNDGFTVTALPAPTVSSITPSTGVNTGTISITNLAGANFQNDATVKLTRPGQPDIDATNVMVVSDSQITCDFDLNGAAAGDWNVVVTNPDEQSGQLDNGFTITAPPAPDVSISKSVAGSGDSGFEPGDYVTFTLAIANEGDALATNITVTDNLPAEILNPSYDSTLTVTPTGAFSYTWAVEELGASANGVITIYGQINPSLDSDFSFVNAASISDPDDVTPSNNSSSVSVIVGEIKVYLPLVMKRWPPVPTTPTITSITPNPSTNGNYTMNWSPGPDPAPTSYDIEENGSVIQTGYVGTSRSFTGKSPGTYTYRVRGRNAYGTGPWSSSQAVMVQSPSVGIPNGDFESGRTIWTEYSTYGWALIRNTDFPGSVTPHGGNWAVWLGGDYDYISYIQQQVTVPTGSPYLAYYHWIASEDVCGYDFGGVIINNSIVADQYDLCSNLTPAVFQNSALGPHKQVILDHLEPFWVSFCLVFAWPTAQT